MGEGTVNDEELVEVMAEGSAGDIWPVLSERERRFHLKAAEKALAALRSAGFQVFRPNGCARVTVFDGDTSETFPGWADPPIADDYEPYFLVPADSGGSG